MIKDNDNESNFPFLGVPVEKESTDPARDADTKLSEAYEGNAQKVADENPSVTNSLEEVGLGPDVDASYQDGIDNVSGDDTSPMKAHLDRLDSLLEDESSGETPEADNLDDLTPI